MKNKSRVFIILLIFILIIGNLIFLKSNQMFREVENKVTHESMKKLSINNGDDKVKGFYIEGDEESIGQMYYESDRIVQAAKVGMAWLVPIFMLFTGFSAKLSRFSQKIGKNMFFTVGIYGIIYNLIDSLANFPLAFYRGYVQSHIFGLSHQPLKSWIRNYLINFSLNTVVVFLLLWVPYKFIKRNPRRWWIYSGVAIIPITVFMYMAHPVIIDPLFNKFKPIDNKTIERSLLQLAGKAKIEDCTILQVDKSKDTSMINAYMTGIGASKRIVLWDTAIKQLNLRELRFVMAHEIGHYVMSHIRKAIFLEIIAVFIVLYIISRIAPILIERYKKQFKFTTFNDVASYPLAIIIINLCLLFIVPSANAYSCYMEKQADTFALEITKDNAAGVSAFEKLSKHGIVIPNPDPLYKMWKYDHPPIKDRIKFFEVYKPWEEGGKLKFQKYIEGGE